MAAPMNLIVAMPRLAMKAATIALRLPSAIVSSYTLISTGELQLFVFLGIVIMMVLVTAAVVIMQEGQRKIPVQYAKRVVGRRMYDTWLLMTHFLRSGQFDPTPVITHRFPLEGADEAIRAARALAPFQPVWLEEPTIPDDVAGHARIAREGGLPIATGENLHTLSEFTHMITAGGVSYPEPDVTNCGGVTVFMKVAHLAEAFNLPVTSHGAHDVTVHLLAAAPNRSYLEAHGFGLDRFIAAPLVIDDGLALAPDRPGHGIEFDWKALDGVRAPA